MVEDTRHECNCPPMRDVFRHGVTTKPPCPVHDTPERLAMLASLIVPAIRPERGPDG